MNIDQLLRSLNRLGFRLDMQYKSDTGWILNIQGNKSLLTDELRKQIKEQKEAILDYLWDRQPVSAGPNWKQTTANTDMVEVYRLAWDDGQAIALSKSTVDAICDWNRKGI
jgi:TubC N-terminal docking domain